MVRQSPERAYEIAFFDEFARHRVGQSASLSRTPVCVRRIDRGNLYVLLHEVMRVGDAATQKGAWF